MRTTAISSGPADLEEPWHIPTQQVMTHLLENPHPEDVCPQPQHTEVGLQGDVQPPLESVTSLR